MHINFISAQIYSVLKANYYAGNHCIKPQYNVLKQMEIYP